MIHAMHARVLAMENERIVQEVSELEAKIRAESLNGITKTIVQMSTTARHVLEEHGYEVHRNPGSDPIDYTVSW